MNIKNAFFMFANSALWKSSNSYIIVMTGNTTQRAAENKDGGNEEAFKSNIGALKKCRLRV